MTLKPVKVFGCVFLFLSFAASIVFSAGEWELSIPLPATDSLWEEVRTLWDKHWDEKNIDDLIGALHQLEKKKWGYT